ncbi:monocarboxylate transporter 6-like [Penaeus indicus]|uniref:monocarboxylate transporter 6-like n=1 Tax=Penaeus indicus TaxID=29960 RepID=UPI00300CCC8B
MMAGVSTGPILAPLLVRFLQEEYDYTGATLITSAVVLHCCVGAALFRPIRTDSREPSAEQSKTHVWRLLLRVIRGTFTNLYILKSPRAVIIAVSGAFTLNSWLNFIALMPFAVQAAGYSLQDAALCVTTSAVCNLVARLIVSALSDWPRFSMRACYMASTATIAATTAAFSMTHDITWLTVIMGVWGFGVGSYMGIYNLIMVHYMGLEKLTSTIGATFMLVGIGFVTVGPAIGLIRDLSESYSASMLVLAGMAAAAFVLWVLMPTAARCDRRKEQRQRNKSQ